MAAASGAVGGFLRDLPSALVDGATSVRRVLRPPKVTNGAASVAHTVKLPKNAIVASTFPVTMRVTPGEWFLAADIAQVRAGGAGIANASFTAVVDFAAARTASGVAMLTAAMDVIDARRWLGASFDTESLLGGRDLLRGTSQSFNTEVRTERLQVSVSGATSIDIVKSNLAVQLPELPADLELRIDGGAAIWTSPGAVVAGDLPADTPAARLTPGKPTNGGTAWRALSNGDLVQDLDLADVITSLLGDPDAAPTDEREITLVLSARVPGAIDFDVPENVESLLRYRARITDGFIDGRKDAPFTTEGLTTIPLPLPSWAASLYSASGTIIATCGPSRTIPPIGPDAELLSADRAPAGASGVPTAELVLDAERSIALRLPSDHGLAVLSAVRVPLRPDKSGCELRAVVLGADNIDPAAPGVQIDGGSGKPTSVDTRPDGAEQWVTLEFPTPVTLPPNTTLFVALHFIRGTATMAATSIGSGTEGALDVWRGAPTGPWEELPDAGGLSGLRGRMRLVGTAPGDRSIAPLRIALGRVPGPSDGVTPSPKGVVVARLADAASTASQLDIVALTPCTVTVRDVVVTVTR